MFKKVSTAETKRLQRYFSIGRVPLGLKFLTLNSGNFRKNNITNAKDIIGSYHCGFQSGSASTGHSESKLHEKEKRFFLIINIYIYYNIVQVW